MLSNKVGEQKQGWRDRAPQKALRRVKSEANPQLRKEEPKRPKAKEAHQKVAELKTSRRRSTARAEARLIQSRDPELRGQNDTNAPTKGHQRKCRSRPIFIGRRGYTKA